MLFMKKVFSVFLAVSLCFTLISCGKNASDREEVIMWLVGSEAQARIINEIAKEFTADTGIKVVCQAISWGDAHSKYLTSIAGEVTPDIGSMGLTWGMEFGELGALVDFKEEFAEDFMGIESKIFPSLLKSSQIGDSVYGVPFDISVQVMYYRKDLIKTPPRTWEELSTTLGELKESGRGMVIDWGSLEWIGYSSFLWQAGGQYYNDEKTKVTVDTPEAAEALGYFSQLYSKGVPKTNVPLEQGLRTGDYPLAISGNWKIISLTVGAPEIAGKWGIAMLPKGPSGKRTAFIGGRALTIFKQSNKQKESWEFIKFLFREKNQLRIYESSLETEDSYLPPNMETWKLLPMDTDHKRVLQQQVKDAKGPPSVLSWDSSARYINEAIQMAVLRKADPATVLKKAQKNMQAELELRKKY